MSARLYDFAVAGTGVTLGDVGGSRGRTEVLARAVGDAVGACGLVVVDCGRIA